MTRLGELATVDLHGGDGGSTSPHQRWRVLVVPLGSLEQHGPHLPLDTDTRIALAVCDALAGDDPTLVVAPAVAIGASGEHQSFPGTLSIGQDALELVVIELVRSADGFAGVVLVNAHGGNGSTLARAVERLHAEARHVLVVSCAVPGGDAHAGRVETSLLLHLCPDLVRIARAEPGDLRPWREIAATVTRDGVGAVSPNGVLGDPTGASAAEGASILAGMVERAAHAISAWRE